MNQEQRHISREDAARWVSGLMEAPQAATLEQHVSTCLPCETLVQHEARVELALEQAVALGSPGKVVSINRFRPRTVIAAAAATAAIAAALMLIFKPAPTPEPSEHEKTFEREAMAITAEAPGEEFAGFIAMPRYEEGREPPAAARSAKEPFPL